MSLPAIEAVLKHSQSKGSARLLLLLIARHVQGEGTQACPSISSLCHEANLNRTRAVTLIRQLESLGELQVNIGAGPHGVNHYTILLPVEKGSALNSSALNGAVPNGGTLPPRYPAGKVPRRGDGVPCEREGVPRGEGTPPARSAQAVAKATPNVPAPARGMMH